MQYIRRALIALRAHVRRREGGKRKCPRFRDAAEPRAIPGGRATLESEER